MTVRYIHLFNRITYAISCTDPENLVTHYAIAICHPEDQFSRKMGRIKAEGRLQSDRFKKHIEPIPFKEFRNRVFDECNLGLV